MKDLLRKLFAPASQNTLRPTQERAADPYAPYAQQHINQIYNLLFCDVLSAYKPVGKTVADWQAVLFADPVSDDAVRALAEDVSAESRVRILAYNLLRERGHPVPKGTPLGVIIEVPLDNGLDVVAAFADGAVRYINQTGKLAVVEGGGLPETEPVVKRMLEASLRVVSAIGPWDKSRLPPPAQPNVRLSFLVSDGLYFGQGPLSFMSKDDSAGPILHEALNLVGILTNAVTERQKRN